MAKRKSTSPFDSWVTKTKNNPSFGLFPADYPICWHAALGRLAIAMNQEARHRELPIRLLRKDDAAIYDHFAKKIRASDFYTVATVTIDKKHLKEAMDAGDIASNFFYGWFSYQSFGRCLRINYYLTEAFLDYSYEGLYQPRGYGGVAYTASELGESPKASPRKALLECATSYILRNFWHNVAHDRCQNITNTNFGDFRGRARYDSDFEADNLSILYLAYSYGIPVKADDLARTVPDPRSVRMLRRNRCNEIFRLRSKARGEGKMTYEESEFRICRSISGYVSGWLLAQGLAAASITVHAIGFVRVRNSDYRRDGTGFAISVNNMRIAYKLPYPATGSRSDQSRYLRDLATYVQTEYRSALQADGNLRRYAAESLKAVFARIGVTQF